MDIQYRNLNRAGAKPVEPTMRRIVLVAIALTAGCTPMQWQKEGASAEQFRADEEDCHRRAWHEASLYAWQYQSMWGPVFARDPYGRGATFWPNSAMVDPYGYQMLEENRLVQFCMESKGYKLVPVPKQ
jgi:hypothetical protein